MIKLSYVALGSGVDIPAPTQIVGFSLRSGARHVRQAVAMLHELWVDGEGWICSLSLGVVAMTLAKG